MNSEQILKSCRKIQEFNLEFMELFDLISSEKSLIDFVGFTAKNLVTIRIPPNIRRDFNKQLNRILLETYFQRFLREVLRRYIFILQRKFSKCFFRFHLKSFDVTTFLGNYRKFLQKCPVIFFFYNSNIFDRIR